MDIRILWRYEDGVILLLIFAAIFVTTRYVSLGSCISAVMFPLLVYMFHRGDSVFVAVSCLIAALAVFKHRENIRRLATGTESKTYFGRK